MAFLRAGAERVGLGTAREGVRRDAEKEEGGRRGGATEEEGTGAAEEEGVSAGSKGGVSATRRHDIGSLTRDTTREGQEEEGERQKGGEDRRRRKRMGKKGREAKKRKLAGEANARSKEEKIMAMMQLIGELYPEGKWSEEEVRSVVEEAYRTADGNYGEEAAEAWGADFEWPEDVRVRDDGLAERCGFNLEAMAKAQHAERAAERLSEDRIRRLVPGDDPDRGRLLSLAQGMTVLTADSFAPTGRPQKMRGLYKRVKNAVNKVLVETWREGLAFIVTKEAAAKIAEVSGPLQYNTVSWAPKKDKPQGRNICDSSDDSTGNALNSEEAARKLEAMYGEIEHPTLEDLVTMVNEYADEMKAKLGNEFRWEDLRLWKGDLRKAFTLLNVRAGDVKFFACELTDGLVLFYHTGLFGWTGTPFCFQVVTRAVERLVRMRIKGRMRMFVDDGMGVTMKQFLEQDIGQMREVCEALLGPLAIAEDKWEWGRRLTWIGWDIDLDEERVTISRRNFMKTLHGFFTLDESNVQVRELEKVASWASRYSTILRVMEPFSKALYAETGGMQNRFAFKSLRSMGARIAVWMWRAMLCLLHLNESTFGRTLNSFRPRPAEVMVEFDASLSGLGLVISDLREGKLLGCGSAVFPFQLGEQSRWQNSAEFIAIVVAIICLVQLGYSNVGIKIRGDNVSSMKWGKEEHFTSALCFSAALVFILLSVAFNINVVETEHVPGEENMICDAMSRGYRPEDLGVSGDETLNLESEVVKLGLVLCDPTKEVESQDSFTKLWHSTQNLIGLLRKAQEIGEGGDD